MLTLVCHSAAVKPRHLIIRTRVRKVGPPGSKFHGFTLAWWAENDHHNTRTFVAPRSSGVGAAGDWMGQAHCRTLCWLVPDILVATELPVASLAIPGLRGSAGPWPCR